MNPHELNLFTETTALRTKLMDSLTDAELAFTFPNNPTLGELCLRMGEVERAYIDSFRSLKMDWSVRNTEAGLAQSVERLKAWYKTLDEEFMGVLRDIPDADLKTKMIDRGNFQLPMDDQYHVYREALLIFCGKCTPYLLAMGKPLSDQWLGWIGKN